MRTVYPGVSRALRALRALPSACIAAIALVLAFALVHASSATAYYNEVADDYPASQDVAATGDALDGSSIPAGTYSITASTSSYMCRISDCTLSVDGSGSMSVTFTISKAYTAIYLGTAEEAAAHTDSKGMDASAYYIGDPATGYVPHKFTIPLGQCNAIMRIATYNAGTKSHAEAVWYTREVVFNFDESMAQGQEAEQAGDEGSSQAGEGSGGTGSSGGTSKAGGSSGAGAKPRPKGNTKVNAQGTVKDKSAGPQGSTPPSAGVPARSSSNPAQVDAASGSEDENEGEEGEDADADPLHPQLASGAIRAIPLFLAQPGLAAAQPAAEAPQDEDAGAEQGASPFAAPVVAAALMAVALAALLLFTYIRHVRPAMGELPK